MNGRKSVSNEEMTLLQDQQQKPTEVSETSSDDTPAAPYTWQKVGPRVYRITGHLLSKIRIMLLGCQGKLGKDQIAVAKLMEDLIREFPDLEPDFIIALGDHFYDDGADSDMDSVWKKQFVEMYKGVRKKFFAVFGNHDLKISLIREYKELGKGYANYIMPGIENYLPILRPSPKNAAAMNPEANYTYGYHKGDPVPSDGFEALFKQEKFTLEDVPKWVLPYPFYSIIIDNEDDKNAVQIFLCDSNNFPRDFLALQINPDEINNPLNQAAWLARETRIANEKGRTVILAQHHALDTVCKRSNEAKADGYLYLTPEELNYLLGLLNKKEIGDTLALLSEKRKELEQAGTNASLKTSIQAEITELNTKLLALTKSKKYNPLLAKILLHQGILERIDLCVAAHDHALYNLLVKVKDYETGKVHTIPQVVSGASGGPRMRREDFSYLEEEAHVFLENFGIAELSIDKKNPRCFEIDFFTTPQAKPNESATRCYGEHIKLAFQDGKWSVVRKISEDAQVENLRTAFLASCKSFQEFLHNSHSHDIQAVEAMHNIVNYLQQPELPSSDVFLKELSALKDKIKNKDFSSRIDANLQEFINPTVSIMNSLGKGICERYINGKSYVSYLRRDFDAEAAGRLLGKMNVYFSYLDTETMTLEKMTSCLTTMLDENFEKIDDKPTPLYKQLLISLRSKAFELFESARLREHSVLAL